MLSYLLSSHLLRASVSTFTQQQRIHQCDPASSVLAELVSPVTTQVAKLVHDPSPGTVKCGAAGHLLLVVKSKFRMWSGGHIPQKRNPPCCGMQSVRLLAPATTRQRSTDEQYPCFFMIAASSFLFSDCVDCWINPTHCARTLVRT